MTVKNGNDKPKSLSKINYPNNFLKEVIVRVDFAEAVVDTEKKIDRKLRTTVKAEFPVEETEVGLNRQFQVSATESTTKDIRYTFWHFHSLDRAKKVTIQPSALIFSYYKYVSFEILQQDFSTISKAIFTKYKQIQISRFGLRYINQIEIEDKVSPLNWEAYFDPRMLSIYSFYPNPATISRIFQIMEFNHGNYSLRFQFGMPNPDFPAPIRRKFFVLDFDGFREGLQENYDLHELLASLHTNIQQVFESSITDNLRAIMK